MGITTGVAVNGRCDSRTSHTKKRLLVPEGRRRKLAGGKPARAGAAPGCSAERAMPQRGIEEVLGCVRPAGFPPALVAPGLFLRCPAGARSQAAPRPGAASAAAALPPANLLRRPSGTAASPIRPSHSLAPNSPAQLSPAHARLRAATQITHAPCPAATKPAGKNGKAAR